VGKILKFDQHFHLQPICPPKMSLRFGFGGQIFNNCRVGKIIKFNQNFRRQPICPPKTSLRVGFGGQIFQKKSSIPKFYMFAHPTIEFPPPTNLPTKNVASVRFR
jgi:hypothetical protein